MSKHDEDDEDDGPFDPEALKKVIMALGNSAEAMAAERAAEEEAAASPNYEPDMKRDAEGIAEFLSRKLGLPVAAVNMVTGEMSEVSIPKPTLGSIRLQLERENGSFERAITELRPHRERLRENGAPRAMIHALRTGRTELMRTFASRQGGEIASLNDDELKRFMVVHYKENPAATSALGVMAGAMLVGAGFTIDEVESLATDPVFQMQVMALRTTPERITKLAIEALQNVHSARARAEQKPNN